MHTTLHYTIHYTTLHYTHSTTLHTHTLYYTHTHYTTHTHTHTHTPHTRARNAHTYTFNGPRCIPDLSQLAYLWDHAYAMFHQEDQSMTWLSTEWLAILSRIKRKESPLWSQISGHFLQNFTHHPYVIFCTFIPFFTTVLSVPWLQFPYSPIY